MEHELSKQTNGIYEEVEGETSLRKCTRRHGLLSTLLFFIFIDAEFMKENQTVPSSMDSGLLKANNKHYQYPQIFEVGSVNMAFNANSFWKPLRAQMKSSRGRAHGPFNTTADSELPSETTEGEPKPERSILLLLKQHIHMESGVPSGSAVKNPPAVKETQV